MHLGQYVSVDKLDDGIYITSKPNLFNEEETIGSLTKKYELMLKMTGFPTQEFIDNLNKCSLVLFELKEVTNE